MTDKQLLQAEMLDILFEHRNKTYGAYALRKNYNQRLGMALGISLGLVLLLILFTAFRDSGSTTIIHPDDGKEYKLVDYVLPPKEVEPDPQPKPKDQPKQVQATAAIEIVPDHFKTFMPTEDDLKDAVPSNKNVDGRPLETGEIVKPTGGGTGGDDDKVKNDPEPVAPGPSYAPAFPGGPSAWMGFLRKFLQTPDALEPGQKVEVRVKFWIDTDGSLSRFEITTSGGPDFDREVLRVMKKMPKWEPAMQNGQRVAVAFTQPVIFLGVEE
jgi:periplasmic protein TonB